jgi:hypothetical protein
MKHTNPKIKDIFKELFSFSDSEKEKKKRENERKNQCKREPEGECDEGFKSQLAAKQPHSSEKISTVRSERNTLNFHKSTWCGQEKKKN